MLVKICSLINICCVIYLICEFNNAQYIIICGDPNTGFSHIAHYITNELEQFCVSESFQLFVEHVKCDCNEVEYTFVTKNNSVRSLIAHMLISDKLKDIVEVYGTLHESDNISVV